MKRCILIVMDSVGVGELPDAKKYNDEGSNTLCNIAKNTSEFKLKNLEAMGLGNIEGVNCIENVEETNGSYGRMMEKSPGKDTTTGHWEMSGIVLKTPFPVYPNGFPKDVLEKFENAIGTKTIGNYASSGTEIIKVLGEEHVKTGYPIVYTSADSVFQIAAHEGVISIEKQYEMCKKARDILMGEHAVGRVIARPFEGEIGQFKRTERRKDYSLLPIKKTILNYLSENNYDVKAVGKIEDIFSNSGITHSIHTHVNMEGVDETIKHMKESFEGLIFTNLVDFDMVYGHRNDVAGYYNALKEFDNRIPEIISNLKDDDMLIITADHGCDPTQDGSDHTREYVPLLVYCKNMKNNINLGTREAFTDIAVTIGDYFNINCDIEGNSFLSEIK